MNGPCIENWLLSLVFLCLAKVDTFEMRQEEHHELLFFPERRLTGKDETRSNRLRALKLSAQAEYSSHKSQTFSLAVSNNCQASRVSLRFFLFFKMSVLKVKKNQARREELKLGMAKKVAAKSSSDFSMPDCPFKRIIRTPLSSL